MGSLVIPWMRILIVSTIFLAFGFVEGVSAQWIQSYETSRTVAFSHFDKIVVAIGDPILRSTDDGESWTIQYESGYAPGLLDFITASSVTVFRNVLFVGGTGEQYFADCLWGVTSSRDSGKTWKPRSSIGQWPDTSVISLAATDSNIFAATLADVFVSADSGQTWKVSNIPIQGPNRPRLLMSTAHAVLVATDSGLYRSSDEGRVWSPIDTTLRAIYSSAFAQWDSAIFAVLSYHGEPSIVRSTTDGPTWELSATIESFGSSFCAAHGLLFQTLDNASGTLLVSTDEGLHWQNVSTGFNSVFHRAVASTVSALNIIVGSDNTGIWIRSMNSIRTSLGMAEINIPPIKLYPNPTAGLICMTGISTMTKCSLINSLGRQMEITPLYSGAVGGYRIDLSNVTAGLYFLVVGTDNIITVPIIKY